MHHLSHGDIVNVDWMADKQGIVAFVNNKQMGPPIKSELMYQILPV